MIYDNDNLACSMTCKKYELIYSKQIFNSHGSRLPYPKAAPGICWLFIKANSAECPGNGHKGPGKWGNRIRRRRERRLRSACCMGNQLNSTRGNSTQLNHNHLGGSSCRACQAEAGKSASAAPQRRGAKKKKKSVYGLRISFPATLSFQIHVSFYYSGICTCSCSASVSVSVWSLPCGFFIQLSDSYWGSAIGHQSGLLWKIFGH